MLYFNLDHHTVLSHGHKQSSGPVKVLNKELNMFFEHCLKSKVRDAAFDILRNGKDCPALREAAFIEIRSRASEPFMLHRIQRLASSWLEPDARYVGILMLVDLFGCQDQPRLSKRAEKSLRRCLKNETHSRNRSLIEDSLKTVTPEAALKASISKKPIPPRTDFTVKVLERNGIFDKLRQLGLR